ncbi:nicotinamide-nucleotide amidohydrolase family protein [Erwinia sp. P6884]|uniref:CinA family protein n=1 Tax=Erwinia sp. P6884 TaxID=3141450 RepID=UPI00319C7634
MNKALQEAAQALGEVLKAKGIKVVTAESCTAGLIGTALGAASGSGAFFTTALVTYTDKAKHRVLQVSETTLREQSAVSEAAVREMVAGAKALTGEAVCLAISGYAGPDGGEDGTPAGTIWFGWGLPDRVESLVRHFEGDSETVINDAALFSLRHCTELLTQSR